jgi:hypothetical protein
MIRRRSLAFNAHEKDDDCVSTQPALSYPSLPSVRAATRTADNRAALLVPVDAAARFDVILPVADHSSGRQVVAHISQEWADAAESETYQVLMAVPKSAAAGELYIQQVDAVRTRFSNVVEQVASDYRETGRYTPKHAAAILDARKRVVADLSPITPGASRFSTKSLHEALPSSLATERLSREIAVLGNLEGRPAHNLARNAVGRGTASPIYADEAPILLSEKVARRLKKVNAFVQVVELHRRLGFFSLRMTRGPASEPWDS